MMWFPENQPPTPLQRLWGNLFQSFYHLVQNTDRGGGKTWFWEQVIRFLMLQDPDIKGVSISDN